ncbi:MAG: PDDEXK nuclease domain-containing protein [Prolixibacteraceae bacterium]|jgi:predicted nuclease of restriction endonuclease-like (RecB) superfamily|nr:PDDEXK nuclease domain-containing protein [Prolixibacteraceae bacterium]
MSLEKNNHQYIDDIKVILETAKQQVYTAVNSAMVQAYWLIGKRIVEEEQNGKERAEYGSFLIKNLSIELTQEFGRGFSEQSLKNFRQFYIVFSNLPISSTPWSQLPNQKSSTPWSQLSWSHFKTIMRVTNAEARSYYIKETAENNWSVRTLDRNIATQYYERLFLSHAKEDVIAEMQDKTKDFTLDKNEFLKSPAILEFLNIAPSKGYTEAQLEKAIIDNLKEFLLELGKGYAFVARQQIIKTEMRDYFIDLVFYNFILKCFVLIDLKTERITHQDVGQMDMYVRMYDEEIKTESDNPTLGIILCSETDQDIARYSILKGNEQLFASKYKLYLPTQEELKAEIEREKLNFKLQHP